MIILKIYMKSGNIIVCKNVIEWEAETDFYGVVSMLSIKTKDAFGVEKLKVPSIQFDQIEAITETVEE